MKIPVNRVRYAYGPLDVCRIVAYLVLPIRERLGSYRD